MPAHLINDGPHGTIAAWMNGASDTDEEVSIHAPAMNELWMHFRIALATLAATITLEGSLDGINWFPLRPEPTVVIGLVAVTVVLGTGATAHVITLANPVANVSLVVPFDSPPPHVRATYNQTSGGSATVGTRTASAFLRAA